MKEVYAVEALGATAIKEGKPRAWKLGLLFRERFVVKGFLWVRDSASKPATSLPARLRPDGVSGRGFGFSGASSPLTASSRERENQEGRGGCSSSGTESKKGAEEKDRRWLPRGVCGEVALLLSCAWGMGGARSSGEKKDLGLIMGMLGKGGGEVLLGREAVKLGGGEGVVGGGKEGTVEKEG